MSADFFKRLGWFALFFLVQVLVLGRIHLFHYATPFLYVYFVAITRNGRCWYGVSYWVCLSTSSRIHQDWLQHRSP